MNQRLPKHERLKSRKQITNLFSKNTQVFYYPFKIIYAWTEAQAPLLPRVLISVPKRSFKLAVDRNRLKRLIRESYRKNKSLITHKIERQESQLIIGFLFVGKELMEFQEVEKAMIKALKKLQDKL